MTGLRADQVADFLLGPGRPALAAYLSRQRWFAAKARGIGEVGIEDWAEIRSSPPIALFLLRADGERYYAPLAVGPVPSDGAPEMLARCGDDAIVDAHWNPDFGRLLLSAIAAARVFPGAVGRFACRALEPWRGPAAPEIAALPTRPIGGEQSNTSLLFGRTLVLKSFRRPRGGLNPDLEITRFLTVRAKSGDVPPLAGWIDYSDADGEMATVAVVQGFVENRGDGWEFTLAGLRRLSDAAARDGETPAAVALADELRRPLRALGVVTGRLHAALASDAALPDFRPEPITAADAEGWAVAIARAVDQARGQLAVLPGAAGTLAALDRRGLLSEFLDPAFRALADAGVCKIRCHGDYHLGQVLKTTDAFAVIDFEGEPTRSLAERRHKQPALRDVAGMLRSFDYAVHAIARERPPEARARLHGPLARWREAARREFLAGYAAAVSESAVRLVPEGAAAFDRACAAFELEKACYELSYEIAYRPEWVDIPQAGIARILGAHLPSD